jgi:hypothetical protein
MFTLNELESPLLSLKKAPLGPVPVLLSLISLMQQTDPRSFLWQERQNQTCLCLNDGLYQNPSNATRFY